MGEKIEAISISHPLHDPASTCRSCREPRSRAAAASTSGLPLSGSPTSTGRTRIHLRSVRSRIIDIYVNRSIEYLSNQLADILINRLICQRSSQVGLDKETTVRGSHADLSGEGGVL